MYIRVYKFISDLNFVMQVALIETRSVFARTKIGPLWNLLIFTLHIFLIGSVFKFIWKEEEFLTFFAISYYLWRCLSDPISFFSHFWRSNKSYIWDYGIEPEFLFYKEVFKIFILRIYYFFGLIFFLFFFLEYYNFNILIFFLSSLFVTLIGCLVGMAWSFLTARYQDLTEITSSIILITYLLTPIFWSPNKIPEHKGFLVELNPVFQFIEFSRSLALENYSLYFSFSMLVFYTILIIVIYLTSKKYFFQKAIYWVL